MSALKLFGPTVLFTLALAFIAGAVWEHSAHLNEPMDYIQWGGSVITSAFLLLPAAVVGFVVFLPLWVLANRRPGAKRVWQRKVNHLCSSYYCGRDDVIFDMSGAHARPEQFVANLFARG
ncbi:hypothetical protein G3T36_02515 [Diaminobutyricibacter tongyongensis]|uniref:Uncharacterized protein n=1 Tax=Leifsonia tongyongensis TaxID=1268043 RepID=A0A6L9XTP0_9MICO|nr:hypothetical protein [Diaminobutyricibacter tongyongensis]NEN04733.1 hypothetical protein [Diaminobutyricibacter tongyongensis]